MSILKQLNTLFEVILPIETGIFSGSAPNEYIVMTPMTDSFELFADNKPKMEVQEIRLSLYSKGNYLSTKNNIVRTLLEADFTITDRRYVGYEENTKYHHYVIDVMKAYEMEG